MSIARTSASFAFARNIRLSLADAEWPDNLAPTIITGPLVAIPDSETIALAGLESGTQEWAVQGQRARDERLIFRLNIATTNHVSATAAEARMEALMSTVEHILRPTTVATQNDMSLGTNYVWNAHVTSYDWITVGMPDGYAGAVDLRITVQARI